jgi:hypothetical protein
MNGWKGLTTRGDGWPGSKAYGPMPFNPSSMVNTAPHFGHFMLESLVAYCPHPKENIATTDRAKNTIIRFFILSHLLLIYFSRFASEMKPDEE